MAKDVKVFGKNCLHHVATFPGNKVPRPLGTQIHATKPNEILHFFFLYIELWYELLRMRTLSISYAQGFLVISCRKVKYDNVS
jgi:hypothetical protein